MKNTIKNIFLCVLCALCGLFKVKPTPDDLKKMEFSSSTQRLGVSFTDKIRNAFRHRWLKKSD
ncbi:MAG TPA: hypothetical protein DDW84_00650 [Phycisphaerales bacterium]|nr:MAG: hypothetical protein A2Y13_10105 [Planctomycetes bacterium GWC2_45_44]HBG77344.1 hypothetical protein [Phycisphaerales bacterium]HBR19613.1 hypothetical protein [Phycisphaerales bacterium]